MGSIPNINLIVNRLQRCVSKSLNPNPPGSRRLQSAFCGNPGEESFKAGIWEFGRSSWYTDFSLRWE